MARLFIGMRKAIHMYMKQTNSIIDSLTMNGTEVRVV